MTDQKHLTDLQRAMEAVRIYQGRVAQLESYRSEPIAIVSMACRLPAGIDTPEAYWELLKSGGDAVGPFPGRWRDLDLYDPDPAAVGKSVANEGGFIERAEYFDNAFFGISPREALGMDPQQRLVLETAWESLERAGVRPADLSESATGVYLGCAGTDYVSEAGLSDLDGYAGTGRANSVVAGRIAYVLGLQGPAMTVDTACSSSLVSLHLACAGLRLRECDVALAGGVTVMSKPSIFVEFSRLGGTSPSSRCRSFSADADGAIWAEACGVLVLKRLSDAKRAGDRILAVVRGSHVNQDGRSQGLTAPNGPAQRRVIQEALSHCRLAPADIDLLEAHGTGTKLGDPIEAGALAAVFGPDRDPQRPLYLGSSKSNVGHAQAAAGVTGLLKLVLALQHETMPRTLHAAQPSPHIEWDGSGLSLLQEARPWPRSERVRRAGISSFGFSGTNAHAILEEAPAQAPMRAPAEAEAPVLGAWPLWISGRTETALRDQAARLKAWLAAHPDASIRDVAFSAAQHRTHFEHRASIPVRDVESAGAALESLAQGSGSAPSETGIAPSAPVRVACLFTGQGSQWAGMGADLYAAHPGFRGHLDTLFAALDRHLDVSLREVMFGASTDLLAQTRYAQPALFAIEVALFRYWQDLGVRPTFVAGHSIGELSAAFVAGVWSLEDAAKLVCARGRLMQSCRSGGAMCSLEATEDEVLRAIGEGDSEVSIAALNGPSQTVVSGDEGAVNALAKDFAGRGRRTRRLSVSHAFHSKHMDEMLAEYGRVTASCTFSAPTVKMVSLVSGELASPQMIQDPGYWVRQVREAVRFVDGMRTLVAHGAGALLECGPDGVLTALVAALPREEARPAIATLRKTKPAAESVLSALGALHVAGVSCEPRSVFGEAARRVDLPTYAFQRERYWLTLEQGRGDATSLGLSPVKHPLLGASAVVAEPGAHLLTGRLSLREQPWLAHHVVQGAVIVPATAWLELALSAAQAFGATAIGDLTLAQPLVVPEERAVQLQVVLSHAQDDGARKFGMYARVEGSQERFALHATGQVAPPSSGSVAGGTAMSELVDWPVDAWQAHPLEGFYEDARAHGFDYGPTFQGLQSLWQDGDTFYGCVAPSDEPTRITEYALSPPALDAALQTAAVALANSDPDFVYLPFRWSDAELFAHGARELRVRLTVLGRDDNGLRASLLVADGEGSPVLSVGGLDFRRTSATQLRQANVGSGASDLFRVQLEPVAMPATGVAAPSCAVVGDLALATSLGAPGYPSLGDVLRAVDAGMPAPEWVVFACASMGAPELGDGAPAVEQAQQGLGSLLTCLVDPRLARAKCAWVSRHAFPEHTTETGLADAPLWGLLRTARNEHPGRTLRMLDLGDEEPGAALLRGFAVAQEPELVCRDGEWRAPRVVREKADGDESPLMFGPDDMVLVTGGLGMIGRATVVHLVRKYGARHLLLTSRRGGQTEDAAALVAAAIQAGALTVEVAACDVACLQDLEATLATIPEGRPLRGVFHLAGVLDDGVVTSQTPDRLAAVMAPKVVGALNLHALTRELDLSAFVTFGSVSGWFGGPGQSTYAAANSFMDALASHRATLGLAATNLAWGLWQPVEGGMAGELSEFDRARLEHSGLRPMSVQHGLALLDRGLAKRGGSTLIPAALDLPVLRSRFSTVVPALLRNLLGNKVNRVGVSSAGESGALRRRLAPLPTAKRRKALVDLVRSELASVLGSSSAASIDPKVQLQQLGLDSLTAVEVRNRLSALAGMELPATLAFDYPTPDDLGGYLLKQAFADVEPPAPAARRSGKSLTVDEPIAIVSMGCRLPGDVADPDAYWDLLRDGRDGIGPFPDRWSELDLFDPDPDRPGKSYVREGGFIRDSELFDNEFFAISPREAKGMDPQQRLVLEVAWEALERAGVRSDQLSGSRTGVYLGCMGSDYNAERVVLEELDGSGMGKAMSVLSGRLSYFLGLQGPTLTLDTACSSSLVALHLACLGLRGGECDMALAGGVTVMSSPVTFVEFSRARGLAADGRCKSFASEADGTGWAEGCGILVLKRLSDAQRDGDRVLAVVRGSAVNQDGRSQGLTAPNGPSQERVICDALDASGLAPSDVDMIEAHGTGTSLGDPIEAGALASVFGAQRDAGRPLYLGSAKSNIGHSQAAAGVAGVMKVVLSMQHDLMPRSLFSDNPSSHIPWEGSGISLLQQARPWPRDGRPRRAGVSSFGISGTNAHVVLEEAPEQAAALGAHVREVAGPVPLWVSGRDTRALRGQAERLCHWLESNPDTWIGDVAYTAAKHRTHFPERAAVVCEDAGEAVQALTALAKGEPHVRLRTGRAKERGRVVFVFPGQGSQWPAMGRDLLAESTTFAQTVADCDRTFAPLLGWSIADFLRGQRDGTMPPEDRVDAVQPAIFTMAVGLAAVWKELGIVPEAVVGHSQGEVAAAVVAGHLSLEEGARVVASRCHAVHTLAEPGTMLMVELAPSDVEARLAAYGSALSVAAVNTPDSTIVSGEPEAADHFVDELTSGGVFCRRIAVDYASHSAQMDPLLPGLMEQLAALGPNEGEIPFYSSVTGELLDSGTPLDAVYWCRNLRDAVRFDRALEALSRDGFGVFVEVSSHPVLGLPLAVACAESEGVVVASLRRDNGGLSSLRESLSELHVQGVEVDIECILAGGSRVDLPTYAFQRERFWAESAPMAATGQHSAAEESLWDAVIRGDSQRFAELLSVPDDAKEAVGPALPHLARWRRQQSLDQRLDRLLYQDTWERLPMQKVSALEPGRWVLCCREPGDPWALALTAAFEQQGQSVERIDAPGDELRASIGEGGPLPLRGVLWLCAASSDTRSETFSEVRAALQIVQATAATATPAPLWIATRSAVRVQAADAVKNPGQAACWGLGRAVSLELPERWGGLVDLPIDADEASATRLLEVLCARDDEDQVAIRRGERLVRRLRRAKRLADSRPFHAEGAVLITGGSGALAGHLATWLAERGAKHLVLASRRGPDAPDAPRVRERLEQQGAKVTFARCDVSDPTQVEALVQGLTSAEPGLRGVAHLAGLGTSSAVAEVSDAELERELAVKAGGAWALHHALADTPLDFFVMYGSGAGLWGGALQAAYGAANAALEGLAEHRRDLGLPGLVIHWGAWSDSGMLTADAELQFRRRGLLTMSPLEGLRALEVALAANATARGVFDVDWSRFAPVLSASRTRPFLLGVDEARIALEEQDAVPAAAAESALAAEVTTLAAEARLPHVRKLLAQETAVVLGIEDVSRVNPNAGFVEQGFDSVMALALSKRIQERTGVATPKTLSFDQPNLEAMAHWLLDQVQPSDSPVEAAAGGLRDDEVPLAIVGAGLKLPGGAEDLESLWDLLHTQRDTLREITPDRFDVAAYFDANPDADGKTYVRDAALIADVAGFDAEFFGVSPREALPMDPQHRLLLEAGWRALEDAGIPPARLRNSDTGVFVGAAPGEYAYRKGSTGQDAYGVTGSVPSFNAGRLSHHLGLQGPALTVDTACSSSLVALRLAVEALRRGDCEVALACGVQVLASPDSFVMLSRTRAVAPDGRSKTFSDAADGYGRGEGVVVLALMRLPDAQAQGRRILGVVRGAAVNHDGTSSGITAPNGTSQQKVLRAALRDAGLSGADIDYVECHGTGTSLGDPIEVQALHQVYGREERPGPLGVGTIKTNVGHLESAAGLAGVCKVLAAFRHEALPASLHSTPRNSHIAWDSLAVDVVGSERPWKRGSRVRRAGVSAFGLSGTNAHVVLEEPPERPPSADATMQRPALLMLSGRTLDALRDQAGRWRDAMLRDPSLPLQDVLHTAAHHRSHFEQRATLVVRSREEAVSGLAAIEESRTLQGLCVGVAPPMGEAAVMFSGQGSQWDGMGRDLYDSHAVFRQALDAVCEAFGPYLQTPLQHVLLGERGQLLDQTRYTQPALFAIEVALYRLWESLGLRPTHLAGHSVGELAAAHVAGVWSLEDAARIVAERGRLMQSCRDDGAMCSLQASEQEVSQALEGVAGEVSIAGLNGPQQTVVSGDADAVAAIASEFRGRGRRVRPLNVSHAFHSAHMDGMLSEFEAVVAACPSSDPQLPIVSLATGKLTSGSTLRQPSYWVRQSRQAVRFMDGARTLYGLGVRTLLECGPDGVLAAMAAQCLEGEPGVAVVASQKRTQPGDECLLGACGKLHVAGVALDLTAVVGEGLFAELPTYPFQHREYWLQSASARADVSGAGLCEVEHPFLAAMTALADGDGYVLTGRLSPRASGWPEAGHGADVVAVPSHLPLEIALAAGRALGLEVCELEVLEHMEVGRSDSLHCQVSVGAVGPDERRSLSVYLSSTDGEQRWTKLANGTLTHEADGTSAAEGFERLAREIEERGGAHEDPAVLSVEAWHVEDEVFGLAATAGRDVASSGYLLAPSLVEPLWGELAAAIDVAPGTGALGIKCWRNVVFYGGADRTLSARVQKSVGEAGTRIWLADGAGRPVLYAEVDLERTTAMAVASRSLPLFRLVGSPVPPTHRAFDFAQAVVVGPPEGLAAALQTECLAGLAELRARAASGQVPRTVIVDIWSDDGASAAGTTDVTENALQFLHWWLGCPDVADADLVWVTRGILQGFERGGALAVAPIIGLLRSARSEHPTASLKLVDLAVEPSREALGDALAVSDEPELCVTGAGSSAPRIERVVASGRNEVTALDPERAVLVTGGMGGIGAALAEHLVRKHGVRHLVLTSRRGPSDPSSKELESRLLEAGAESVSLEACDVSDRPEVAALIERTVAVRPVGGVFHLAGVVDDGLLLNQTPEKLRRVLGPKAQGALHLHELTLEQDLSAFVLFSSAAGVLGAAGQSNYAAANACLDVLASHRRALGMPALSLAWGPWESGRGMTAHLSAADLSRMERQGFGAMTTERGLAMLDVALAEPDGVLLPMRMSPTRVAGNLAGYVPPMLRGVLTSQVMRSVRQQTAGLRRRLSALPEAKRLDQLTEVVQSEIAAVLGLANASEVDPRRELQRLGLDSLMSVEIRNRLSNLAGVPMPSTLAFDYPTPAAIAKLLGQKMKLLGATNGASGAREPAEALAWAMGRLSPETLQQAGLLDSLMQLASAQASPIEAQPPPAAEQGNGSAPAQDDGEEEASEQTAAKDMSLAAIRAELRARRGAVSSRGQR